MRPLTYVVLAAGLVACSTDTPTTEREAPSYDIPEQIRDYATEARILDCPSAFSWSQDKEYLRRCGYKVKNQRRLCHQLSKDLHYMRTSRWGDQAPRRIQAKVRRKLLPYHQDNC